MVTARMHVVIRKNGISRIAFVVLVVWVPLSSLSVNTTLHVAMRFQLI